MVAVEQPESDACPEGRASWPVRRYALGDEPHGDLSETTSIADRIAMMWPLALEAWALAGVPVPEGRLQDLPSRIRRGGEE